MEESSDVPCEENKENGEKKKGKRFKSPSQVQALAEFYNEHEYPTESMKAELADRIGLTVKQVSGWFCHRRLKDKRLMKNETLALGRQDLSSGVIQDRGSGMRQDSCGSTKQADNKPSDWREAESRRLSGEDLPIVEPMYEQRRHYDVRTMDDTSSESGSDIREAEGFYPLSRDLFDVGISQYVMPNEFAFRGRERKGPSGYLKIKGRTENAAITAVKRQLGKHYRADGPPLGVDFDPLPPGAFEFPSKYPSSEQHDGGVPSLQGPVDTTERCKQASIYNRHPDLYKETVSIRNFGGPIPDTLSYRHPSKLKPFASPSHNIPYPYEQYSFRNDEYPATEVSAYNRPGPKDLRPYSFSDHHIQPSVGELTVYQDQPRMHAHPHMKRKILNRRELIESKSSNYAMRARDSFASEGGVSSRLMDEEFDVRRSQPLDEELHGSLVREHVPSRVKTSGQRGRDEVQRQHYAVQSLYDQPQRSRPFRGSASDAPSSLYEGEIAETSSSMD